MKDKELEAEERSEKALGDKGVEFLGYLQRLVPTLITRAEGIRFDSTDLFDLYVTMLYASIIELGNSICRLLSNGEATGTRTLTRMTMEAFVDLTNLMSDRTYVNNLQVRELRDWQLTYERAAKGNPYFAGIAREPGFEERRETEARELETLQQQGFNRLSAEDRFRRAGMSEDYDGAYRWMSSDSHNSLRSLVQRHMNVIDEKKAELHILMELDLDGELSVLVTVSELLIGASKLVHKHFRNDLEFVTDLEQELAALVND